MLICQSAASTNVVRQRPASALHKEAQSSLFCLSNEKPGCRIESLSHEHKEESGKTSHFVKMAFGPFAGKIHLVKV